MSGRAFGSVMQPSHKNADGNLVTDDLATEDEEGIDEPKEQHGRPRTPGSAPRAL